MGTRSGGLVPILVCAPIPSCRFFRQENEGVPHPCRDLCDRVGILTSRSAFKTKAPTLLYPVASAPSVVDCFLSPDMNISPTSAEHLCYTGTSSTKEAFMAETRPQTFANHTRWDPPFHFFVLPVFVIGLILTRRPFFRAHYRRRFSRSLPRLSPDSAGVRSANSGIQRAPLLAQGARPRNPPGRAVAPDALVAGAAARPHSRVDRRPTLRSAFRLRRRTSQVGRARHERKVASRRNQEVDPNLAPRLLASVSENQTPGVGLYNSDPGPRPSPSVGRLGQVGLSPYPHSQQTNGQNVESPV